MTGGFLSFSFAMSADFITIKQKGKSMKKYMAIVILLVFAVIGSINISYAQPTYDNMGTSMSNTKTAVDLRLAMRKLWEDRIVYTRNYIISAIAGLDDTSAIAKRLLKNADEIGDAIKPYYGDGAGKNLSILLQDQILIAIDVINADKIGNNDEMVNADKKWRANAADIALFLSGVNSNWVQKDLADMLYKHLEYTTGEIVSRLKTDWVADIAFYDKGHVHILMFADVLTDGIVKQFTYKFQK